MRTFLALALALLLGGCAQDKPEKDRSGASEAEFMPVSGSQASDGVDTFTQEVRKAHAEADRAQAGEEPSREALSTAAVQLSELFDRPASASPHTLAIRQDLAARAAEIFLASGNADQARAMAHRGLELSDKPTVLRTNLFIALADAEESLGNKEAAQLALSDALAINKELLTVELENP